MTSIIIIDDSAYNCNRLTNQQIIKRMSKFKVFYYGKIEQYLMFKQLNRYANLSGRDLRKYCCPLGGTGWDLGSVRNHILLLANVWNNKSGLIIMLDDDIKLLPSMQAGKREMGSLAKISRSVIRDNLAIIGGSIEGAPDISILEKTCWSFQNLINVDYFEIPKRSIAISGGLMVFSTRWAARIPFPRTYNEDWIWMRHCSMLGGRLRKSQLRAVHLGLSKSAANYKYLYRESIGELFFEGWNWAYKDFGDSSHVYCVLKKESFWNDIIQWELKYINRIKNSLTHNVKSCKKNRIKKQLQQTKRIIDKTYSIIKVIYPRKMVHLANNYIMDTILWRKTSRKISTAHTKMNLSDIFNVREKRGQVRRSHFLR